MNIQQLLPAYQQFHNQVGHLLNIKTAADYDEAVQLLESLFELAEDQPDDPYGELIDLIGSAINNYEAANDPGMSDFIAQSQALPTDIALLGTLIDQHGLTYDELPEIGKKSMVSQVMNGKRALSRKAIEALAHRFGIPVRMFF